MKEMIFKALDSRNIGLIVIAILFVFTWFFYKFLLSSKIELIKKDIEITNLKQEKKLNNSLERSEKRIVDNIGEKVDIAIKHLKELIGKESK